MPHYPEPLRRLIEAFMVLPGIGRKTAERFAFSLLQGKAEAASDLASAITELREHIMVCQECGQFSERALCSICSDGKRNKSELCVVADGRDIFPLEQTGLYHGRYFVLGGLINPIEGIHATQLRIKELQTKLKTNDVKELILALNANLEGDATGLYLIKLLKPLSLKITRLARGLPTGSRLEYADEATLQSAFANRREV
ncbi:recombination protein RecR [Candidatus Uhrbacteria bacterium RIFCSPLOWO2_02_FULL_48_12]|uniref:Recombination protein RecR n=1 Tax=Candidatus Uhrbacteria bacterium RIFCSPLOWO2_02_FULL_48_12 TaxID=1802407 RepID=A0A1F7VA47_9BACT|nr:MAG: recombination protein RecR [Candidatus Uhrbacteria bacterium RIFCSPLOWO2_02_FULL_48_12]